MYKSNRGQLTIFMGISLIIMMSMLAFIINVGLFVKAKINLQNAVDSAAFAGAATQARQLTNIAYMNWELRNTYKEWLFKYYVIGQMGSFSHPNSLEPSKISGNGTVDFRLSIPAGFQFNSSSAGTSNLSSDLYNVPSICIHNGVSTNICPLYMIPGLPRFQAIGVAGITETHEALVNQLTNDKAADCAHRTKINFLAALNWTYGSGLTSIPEAPVIAANRPGAWIQALEIAMRIRNLEMIVNRPPIASGFTYNEAMSTLVPTATEMQLNERPIKAMQSAYKNLSGGKYKENGGDELSGNFKLYELPPQPYSAPPKTVSSFLIPQDTFLYPGPGLSTSPLQKYYLDLQIMTLNYAIMYSTFSATKYKYGSVDADASCGISKTALPVPGYILGYVKNPNVMTYYAVKGETKFIGLFYPFRDAAINGITLTAYAAAKPFGGRIGPSLFTFGDNDTNVNPRLDSQKKSAPYISGLVSPTAQAGPDYKVGYPIPFDSSFWVSDTQRIIGGVPGNSASPTFGIPNMIYDFDTSNDLSRQDGGSTPIQDVAFMFNSASLPPSESMGLYDRMQFRSLKASLGATIPGSQISSDEMTAAVLKSRRATKYDAINYLIPDFKLLSTGKNNATPYIISNKLYPHTGGDSAVYQYKIYAPLTANGVYTLYPNPTVIKSIIVDYLEANSPAVTTYLKDLLKVANSIASTSTGTGDTNLLLSSAKSIHINAAVGGGGNEVPPELNAGTNCANLDIASQFHHFFRGSGTFCNIVPIETIMNDYINANSTAANDSNLFFLSTYYDGQNALDSASLMTAYFPGSRQGAKFDGTISNPLSSGGDYSGKRNFYSTKFFHMAKIMDGADPIPMTRGKNDYEQDPLLREDPAQIPADLTGKVHILNPLKYDVSTGIKNSYYLDF